jgi:ATP-dependent protease ClpP protease subunit
MRLDSFGTDRIDLDDVIEKTVAKTLSHGNANRINDRIYVVADKEIHFTINIDDSSIERLKRLISRILTQHKNELVVRVSSDDVDGNESGSDSESDTDKKKFTIRYVVHSPGGSVASVLGFIDFIRSAKKKYSNLEFESVLTGFTASAGTIMCVVADKRKMTQNAFAMIHELSGSSGFVNYTRIKTHHKFTKKLHKTIVNTYLRHTGKDPNNKKDVRALEKKLLKETWLQANEYRELGFVDEVI